MKVENKTADFTVKFLLKDKDDGLIWGYAGHFGTTPRILVYEKPFPGNHDFAKSPKKVKEVMKFKTDTDMQETCLRFSDLFNVVEPSRKLVINMILMM